MQRARVIRRKVPDYIGEVRASFAVLDRIGPGPAPRIAQYFHMDPVVLQGLELIIHARAGQMIVAGMPTKTPTTASDAVSLKCAGELI